MIKYYVVVNKYLRSEMRDMAGVIIGKNDEQIDWMNKTAWLLMIIMQYDEE